MLLSLALVLLQEGYEKLLRFKVAGWVGVFVAMIIMKEAVQLF